MSLNKVQLIGRLGQNPEVKTFDNGSAVTNFSIATSSKWKDKSGEKQEKTTWHNIQAWGSLGDICAKYLSKGRQVYVEGEIETRQYEKDGVKCYATSVKANNVQFLGSASENSLEMASTSGSNELPNHAPTFDSTEEMPF